jgi:glycosyltransferase involved in cell wall biosynthesis
MRKSVKSLLLYLPALIVAGGRLARAMREDQCKRLQVNDFYLLEGAVARLFGFRGRIITWVRFDPVRLGFLMKGLIEITRRTSNAVVAVSSFVMGRLTSVPAAILVYDSVGVLERNRRHPLGQRLLFVGNYIDGKGQERAIGAFSLIADTFPEAELIFCGGDMGLPKNRADREGLEAMAASSPAAERIHFYDFEGDLAPLRSTAYAAINFSRSETFSLTCQEASAAGLPVIATRSGGPQEIIDDGESGFLVPVDDVGVMADRMSRLLSEPALAERMGERGRQIVAERFPPQQFREKFRALFELR